jgi:hypothetical protein
MSIYLVMSNDAPITTFRSMEAAREYISRQPVKTINGHHIHWHIHKLELADK